jgi:hypothetical protein
MRWPVAVLLVPAVLGGMVAGFFVMWNLVVLALGGTPDALRIATLVLIGCFSLGVLSAAVRKYGGPHLGRLDVAWLAREFAADNYIRVARAPHDPRDIWASLQTILRRYSARPDINRDTTFFDRPASD